MLSFGYNVFVAIPLIEACIGWIYLGWMGFYFFTLLKGARRGKD